MTDEQNAVAVAEPGDEMEPLGSSLDLSLGALVMNPKIRDAAMEVAKFFATSDLVPKDYRGKPANVLLGMSLAHGLGFKNPLLALGNIANVNGRLTLFGDLPLAMLRARPDFGGIEESWENEPEPGNPPGDNCVAVCKLTRNNDGAASETITRSFGVGDAKRARLWGKEGPWSTNPRRMMLFRARAFAIRDLFGDVLQGVNVDADRVAEDSVARTVTVQVRDADDDVPTEQELQDANDVVEAAEAEAVEVEVSDDGIGEAPRERTTWENKRARPKNAELGDYWQRDGKGPRSQLVAVGKTLDDQVWEELADGDDGIPEVTPTAEFPAGAKVGARVIRAGKILVLTQTTRDGVPEWVGEESAKLAAERLAEPEPAPDPTPAASSETTSAPVTSTASDAPGEIVDDDPFGIGDELDPEPDPLPATSSDDVVLPTASVYWDERAPNAAVDGDLWARVTDGAVFRLEESTWRPFEKGVDQVHRKAEGWVMESAKSISWDHQRMLRSVSKRIGRDVTSLRACTIPELWDVNQKINEFKAKKAAEQARQNAPDTEPPAT